MPECMVHAIARPVARQRVLQRVRLQIAAAGQAVHVTVGEGLLRLQSFAVLAVDHVQLPFQREPVAILDHLGDLVVRVDVHQRQRNMAEEGFARQPEQHGAVLADRPQHAQVLEVAIGLTQDVYALGLEFFQVIHTQAFSFVGVAGKPGVPEKPGFGLLGWRSVVGSLG